MSSFIRRQTSRVAAVMLFSALTGHAQLPQRMVSELVKSSADAVVLSKSVLKPVGTTSRLDSSTSPIVTDESVWTSTADGRDYKVRVDGDYIYVEWVNLPRALQKSSAFLRSELKKSGDKWIGQTTAYMPFDYQHDATKTIWCRVQAAIEIDKVSASRIEGRSRLPTSFNQKKCLPENLEWKPFTWIPK